MAEPKKYRVIERPEPGEVRVIDEEGGQVGVLAVAQALEMAAQRGLDLVELDPHSAPPTCKLMNYGRFKYAVRKKLAKSKKVVRRLKEVKLRPKTEEHDLQVKIRQALKFIKDGHKVQVTMMFRGREEKHPEFGFDIMQRFVTELAEFSRVEKSPVREARNRIGMLLAPKA